MSEKVSRKILMILTALSVAISTLLAPTAVYAYEAMDMSRNGSASLTLELPASSDSVKLYFVADMDDQTKITIKDEYKKFGVDLENVKSPDEWAAKAEVLTTQLIGSDITPEIATTDGDNKARFENLSYGIYLVSADRCQSGDTRYKVMPNFISVPNSTDGKTWIYDVNAVFKYEPFPTVTPGPEKVRYAVRKTWTNDAEGTTRPDEVVVRILRSYEEGSGAESSLGDATEEESGAESSLSAATEEESATESSLGAATENTGWTEVETVSLNKNNNWHYEWSAEADGAKWTVQEVSAPGDYAVDKIDVVESDGVTCFTIINRYLTPTPTPTTTPTVTPRTPTTSPTITQRAITPRPTSTPGSYKATATPRPNVTTTVKHSTPKTGDDQNILLPIIGVLAAGAVLVLLGMNIKKKSGKDE